MNNITVMKSNQAFGYVTEPLEGHPGAGADGIKHYGFEHITDLAFFKECYKRFKIVWVWAWLTPVAEEGD